MTSIFRLLAKSELGNQMENFQAKAIAMTDSEWARWVAIQMEAPNSDIREYVSEIEELRDWYRIVLPHDTPEKGADRGPS